MSDKLRVPWAVDAQGNLVKVSSAKSGWQESLFCPVCHWNVIARKGPDRVHHFAHPSGAPCSPEELYHSLAQKLLMERLDKVIRAEGVLDIEECCFQCGCLSPRQYRLDRLWCAKQEWSPAEGTVRADVALLRGGQAAVVFEINATHATTEEARGWYAGNDITVYELSALIQLDLEEIETADFLRTVCLVLANTCAGCGARGVREKTKPSAPRTINHSSVPMGKALWVRDGQCVGCGISFKIGFGTIDRKPVRPEHFSAEDEAMLLRAGAKLRGIKIKGHQTFPDLYPEEMLANQCPECGSHTVDFNLERLVNQISDDPNALPVWRDSTGPTA